MKKPVDAIINVLGKPYQTGLSILSLLKYSHKHINIIYVIFEEKNKTYQIDTVKKILEPLANKVVYYTPKAWFWVHAVNPEKFFDEESRLGLRYQYGMEHSDADYVYIMHNDVVHHADVVGAYLASIGDHMAVGRIGMCHNCPARWAGLCDGTRYQKYRPDLDELRALYLDADPQGGWKGFLYHLKDFCEEYRTNPWPLPCCRVNEYSCLVNLKTYKQATIPYGTAYPFGAYGTCGDYLLDIGCRWFHDIHLMGYTCKHLGLGKEQLYHIVGHGAMFNQGLYVKNETFAFSALRRDYHLRLGKPSV
ncbi:hypothetical protein [Desulfoplanes sp.]